MSSKGVTPIIATALLIGIAVSTALTASIFMQNSLDDVRSGFEDDLEDSEREDRAELSIEYGYNQGGYTLIDIRNTGSIALPLRDGGNATSVGDPTLAIYLDGRPAENWEYLADSNKTVLSQDGRVSINTSEPFPVQGNYTQVEITGPYSVESSIICYNDGSPSC